MEDNSIIWKDLEDIYGKYYEVSNTGIIRSKKRTLKRSNCNTTKNSFELSRSLNKEADLLYSDIRFTDGKKLNKRRAYIHKEVAIAFLEEPTDPKRKYIKHKDGDRKNNNSDNLEWITFAEVKKIKRELKQLTN
ncbi:HNH endonuclease [Wenyingzhuangia sp. 2_MG-2023]|uniref:HNH endonuclease n=1 Tax=Wenyingzhuangia sp. 2_MG-2023 TaxID=3062639 RepID=UPI0026E13D05|nr:HNH endonuclease [Wenyingzhuangia sp. 2_MG-2023]MDO6737058.1 HNH endonuclease [Wenyingzhuangia sp. 2_MG-2023]